MDTLQKISSLLRISWTPSGTLLLAALALAPISADAQCASWDASGAWALNQRGVKNPIQLQLRQNGKALSGSAEQIEPPQKGSFLGAFGRFGGPVGGSVTGTVLGDRFSIEISWSNSQVGVYNAKVAESGRLDGEAYEKSSPNVRHVWNSVGSLKCAPTAPAAPPSPAPKPLKSGRKPTPKPSADAPVKTSAIAPKAPFITASSPVIPTPYHPLGVVVLSWDAGPDHSDVAVWLSMNNGTEIPAFSTEHAAQSPVWKQPQTSIPVNLQRRTYYKFVLKDSSERPCPRLHSSSRKACVSPLTIIGA